MKTKKLSITLFSLSLCFFLSLNSKAAINYVIVNDSVVCPDTIEGTNYYELDLNGDDIVDFKIGARFELTFEFSAKTFDCHYTSVVSLNENRFCAGPLFDGDTISSSLNFVENDVLYGYAVEHGGYLGYWPSTIPSVDDFAFIGLEFDFNNETYFGWIKLKTDGQSVTIESFAWNQVANQPIFAGQTN